MANQILTLYGTVYIVEDIIHNKIFMKGLEEKGMIKVETIDDIPNGSVVMFSAHGVSPQMLSLAEKKELTIIDATCPLVRSVQVEAKIEAEAGNKIVIIGNRGHAEIVALLGYTRESEVYVVENELDVDLLPDLSGSNVCYFTQTTLDCEAVTSILSKLKERIPNIKSSKFTNICYATKERQDVVRAIAKSVDLVLVVGSKHSSNANHLVSVAQNAGAKRAILIDSKADLLESDLESVDSMAITSAASTPENLVDDLVKFLEQKFEGITFEDFKISAENGK